MKRHFLDRVDHDRVVKAIRDAEALTSGEIRVHVSPLKVKDARAAAEVYFREQGLDRRPGRNSVLLFIAPRSRKLAILGDSAIHERTGDGRWRDVVIAVSGHLRHGRFTDGLVAGIRLLGEDLARQFPRGASVLPNADPVTEG